MINNYDNPMINNYDNPMINNYDNPMINNYDNMCYGLFGCSDYSNTNFKNNDVVINDTNSKNDTVVIKKNKIIDINNNRAKNIINKTINKECHAYKCNINHELKFKYQGLWCDDHLKDMKLLRSVINRHNGGHDELLCRLKEIKLRKYPDINHIMWAFKMLHKSYEQNLK